MFIFFICFSISLKQCEINESLRVKGFSAIDSYDSQMKLQKMAPVIISMRWNSIEEQFHHFIFGASIAFALNRPIQIEMLKFPITGQQPQPFFDYTQFDAPGDYMSENYTRLRVDTYFPCRNKTDITKADSSRPILIRNYATIETVYSSHLLSPILYKSFEYRAAYFFSRRYLLKNTEQLEEQYKDYVGVDINKYYIKNKDYLRPDRVFNIFRKYLNQHFDKRTTKFVFLTFDDSLFTTLIKSEYHSAIILTHDYRGFSTLCSCKMFVGTYRSDFSSAVSLSRDKPGFLIDYVYDNIIEQTTSLSGIVSPYIGSVEELPNLINSKLKGCKDNSEELQQVINTFVQ